MNRLFLAIYDFLHPRKAVSFIVIILAISGLAWIAYQLEFEEDITKMMPLDTNLKQMSEVLEDSGIADRTVITFTGNRGVGQLKSAADTLAERMLSQHGDLVGELRWKVPNSQLKDVYEVFHEHLPIFTQEADYEKIRSQLHPDSIDESIHSAYRQLISPTGLVFRDFILNDPLGIAIGRLEHLQDLQVDEAVTLTDGYFTSTDQEHVFVYLKTAFPSNETDNNATLVMHLDSLISSTKAEFEGVDISYFGTAPVAVANAERIKKDISITVTIAMIILTLIIVLYFRRLSRFFLLFTPVVFGAATSLAVLVLTVGQVSAISIGIGSVLLGISIDFSLHIITHLSHAGDKRKALKEVISPVLTSSITTSLAFACLFFVRSEALQDLGLFSSVSVLSSAVFALIFLPLVVKSNADDKKSKVAQGLNKVANYPLNKKKPIVWSITAISLAAIFLFPHIEFESDMSKMNFLTPELSAAETLLKEATQGGDMKFAMSAGETLEEALEAQVIAEKQLQELVDSGKVERFSALSGLLPDQAKQAQRIEAWNLFWTDSLVAQVKNDCVISGTHLGFQESAFSGFYDLLEKDHEPTDLQSLREDFGLLITPFINEKDGRYYVSSLIKTQDNSDLEITWADPRISSFDRSSMTSTVLQILKTDFNQVVGYSMILVFLILIGSFRRIELALLTFIPIVLSWLWSLGIMVALGLKFTIFNVIVSTFIFGLGVDYCIFMTRGLVQGHATNSKSLLTFRTSIILSMITTLVGIGVLIFAEHPSLRSIATLSIIGIISVVIVSFTIQPLLFRFFVSKRTSKGLVPLTFGTLIASASAYTHFLIGCGLLGLLSPLLHIVPGNKKKLQHLYHKVVCYFGGNILNNTLNVKYVKLNPSNEQFDKPCLIISNHHSFLDILIMINQTPNLVMLTNNWVYNSPFFGRVVRRAGYYNVTDGFEGSIPALKKRVEEGYSVAVFPEGTRSRVIKMARFKKGAFLLADEMKLDVVPIIMHGTHHVMTKGDDFLLKNGRLTAQILPRISHDDESFGTGYRERTKAISKYFKAEFQKTREKVETPEYYRDTLRKAYAFRGEEVLSAVNSNWRNHHQRYAELHVQIPRDARVLVTNCGYGDLCFLLAKCAETREVYGFDDRDSHIEVMRNVGVMPDNVTVAESGDPLGFDFVVDGDSMCIQK